MRCDSCKFWKRGSSLLYEDGYHVNLSQAPMGKGNCEKLGLTLTEADFGCLKYEIGDAADQNPTRMVEGAPWQHSQAKSCPECYGRGSKQGACDRCQGTGYVRHYDDGYVGEERTRLHPVEREIEIYVKGRRKGLSDGYGDREALEAAVKNLGHNPSFALAVADAQLRGPEDNPEDGLTISEPGAPLQTIIVP